VVLSTSAKWTTLVSAATNQQPVSSQSQLPSVDALSTPSPLGAVVGGVAGGVLLIIIIVIVVWFAVCRKHRRREQPSSPASPPPRSPQYGSVSASFTGSSASLYDSGDVVRLASSAYETAVVYDAAVLKASFADVVVYDASVLPK